MKPLLQDCMLTSFCCLTLLLWYCFQLSSQFKLSLIEINVYAMIAIARPPVRIQCYCIRVLPPNRHAHGWHADTLNPNAKTKHSENSVITICDVDKTGELRNNLHLHLHVSHMTRYIYCVR
jgi:hypothetical protein